MASKYYHIMSFLADCVYKATGEQVYRNTMEQIQHTLPSKEAQYSNLGMALGRQKMSQDRHTVHRRKSSMKLKSNRVAPDNPEVNEALQKLGLGDMVVNTEEEQHHVMKLIRAMPRPLPVKRQMRDLLMAGPIAPSKGFQHRVKNKWNSFKISWREFLYMFEAWRGAIKKIEGHQGTGVVSYFVFLRWLFFLNLFIFLLLFWVITFFQVSFDPVDTYDSDITGSGSTVFTTTNAVTCSARYDPNVSSNALDLILDFVQGTGWMEDTAMFNGYYVDRKVKLAASNYNLPLAYFLVTVAVLLISLVVMVRNTLSDFKDTILAQENSKQMTYCNSVFAGFDYSVAELEAVELKQKSIYRGLVAELEEQKYEMQMHNRTTGEKCRLYTVRFFVNFLILILLGGAGAAIYYAQDYSTNFTTKPDVTKNHHALVILLVQFLPSIVIGLLNGIYPLIFDVLVIFEKYRPAFVIKISLIRMVFLKLASLAMVVASLYVQITCSDHDTCLVGRNKCPAIECWETYVGSAVYKLVVMDFIINVGVTLGVELPRKLITTKCESKLLQKIGPAIFDIPKNVLDLVYTQSLLWLGFYFAPLISAVSLVTFFLVFYLKMLSAMYNTVPPEKPYQASKSNSFFTVILMVAFFLICVPVGYTMSNMDPSPMCGPFRIYSQPSDIIDVQINNGANWFQTFWVINTSAAVVASIIILLLLVIYYCSALNSAHKDLVVVMKDQLVMEGKDKQYLLLRIAELTGNPPKKQPPPRPKPQLKTVDEKAPLPGPVVNPQMQPERNEDVGVERSEEMNLYGKEKSIVHTPLNDAPPPASYKQEKNVTPAGPFGDFQGTTNHPNPEPSPFEIEDVPPVVLPVYSLPVNKIPSPPVNKTPSPPVNKIVSPPVNKRASPPVNQRVSPPVERRDPTPVNKRAASPPMKRQVSPVTNNAPQNNGLGSSPLFANKGHKKTPREALDDW